MDVLAAIDAAWAVVVAVVVTGLFGLATVWVQQTLTARNQRRSRIDDAGRQAARAVLDVLDEVRRRFEEVLSFSTDEVSNTERYDMCYRLKREIIMIPDAEYQERLDQIHTALWDIDVCARESGHYLQQVAALLYAAGEKLVGGYSTGQPIPPESDHAMATLKSYGDMAKTYQDHVDRELEEQEKGPPTDT